MPLRGTSVSSRLLDYRELMLLANMHSIPLPPGIHSTQSTGPELRSFSVEAAPPFRTLSCDTNATFSLKLGVGERELVVCPAGCLAHSSARVYGSGGSKHIYTL